MGAAFEVIDPEERVIIPPAILDCEFEQLFTAGQPGKHPLANILGGKND
jgi:hypothetical protein